VCLPMRRVSELPGAVNGGLYRVEMKATRPAADYTPRVTARHPNARVPIEAWPITWYR
jgi:starch phosphorylase